MLFNYITLHNYKFGLNSNLYLKNFIMMQSFFTATILPDKLAHCFYQKHKQPDKCPQDKILNSIQQILDM